MKFLNNLFIIFLLLSGVLFAQETDTTSQHREPELMLLEETIQLGLQNNFGILVARNEAEAAQINKSLGNAGFLPSVEITGRGVHESERIRETVDGERQPREDLDTDFLSLDLSLDWTFFDGLRMFTTYDRLTELEKLGETEARIQIENIITEIITAYYNIVLEKKRVGILENSVSLSEDRYDIAVMKEDLGSGSEYEVLLAQSDLNSDRAEVMRQEVTLNDAKLNLIQLLDLDSDLEIDVEEDIELKEELFFDELHTDFLNKNPELLAARVQANVAKLETREVRQERLPTLSFNMGYNLEREEERLRSPASVALEELSGFRVGVTARFNIFDGFNTSRRVQLAQINQKNSELLVNESAKILETSLYSEYKNYTRSRDLIDLEAENLDIAGRTFAIAIEMYRLATITSVEFREAQRIVLDTENRLINAQYDTKISEIELLRLSGNLGDELNF